MKIQLTPSYYLTDDEEDQTKPIVVYRPTGEKIGPDDVRAFYASWGPMPARQAVRRAAQALSLSDEESALLGRFCGPGRPTTDEASAHIHLRCSMMRKNAYVKAARQAGKNLTEWAFEVLDQKAGIGD